MNSYDLGYKILFIFKCNGFMLFIFLLQSKPLASSTPVLDTIAKIKTPSSKSSTKLR